MPQFSPGDLVAYRPTQRGSFSEDEFYKRYNPSREPFVYIRTMMNASCFIRVQSGRVELVVSICNLVHSGPPETVRAMSNKVLREYQNAAV